MGDAGHFRGRSRPQLRAMKSAGHRAWAKPAAFAGDVNTRPPCVGDAGHYAWAKPAELAGHNSAAIADRISVKSFFLSLIRGTSYYFTNLTPASVHFSFNSIDLHLR